MTADADAAGLASAEDPGAAGAQRRAAPLERMVLEVRMEGCAINVSLPRGELTVMLRDEFRQVLASLLHQESRGEDPNAVATLQEKGDANVRNA